MLTNKVMCHAVCNDMMGSDEHGKTSSHTMGHSRGWTYYVESVDKASDDEHDIDRESRDGWLLWVEGSCRACQHGRR